MVDEIVGELGGAAAEAAAEAASSVASGIGEFVVQIAGDILLDSGGGDDPEKKGKEKGDEGSVGAPPE